MHFYEWNIGDYAKKTQHLTNEEDLAYRRALDMYYDTEKPLDISNIPSLSRRLRVGIEALQNVIEEFFPDGVNKHAEEKIAAYYAFIDRQKNNGRLGGRPKKTQAFPKPNPSQTQKNPVPSQPLTTEPLPTKPLTTDPLTNNQGKSKDIPSPSAKAAPKNGTRLPEDWVLPKSWGEYARTEKPNWTADDVRRVAEDFRDHWLGKSGKDATKVDWLATWRKWVRSPLNDIKPGPNKFNPNAGRDIEAERRAFINGDSGNVIDGEYKHA